MHPGTARNPSEALGNMLELLFDQPPTRLYSVHQEYAGASWRAPLLPPPPRRLPPPPACRLCSLTTPLHHAHRPAAAATPHRTPHSNFLRGCLWSPDGACLLTASDDNW